ncbi:hypothetical protein Micbo1qcDRAFT_219865 [Microdochium bolleyi]|uniref:Uncharacterized protein n=1 Tax=Microdochium bolleyi TaxID=196109 RepID=A0A136IM28_9PEZI|nr:hypothetical protein Micbo1qcDRAFT_219865 [Microdochium bolleyi]
MAKAFTKWRLAAVNVAMQCCHRLPQLLRPLGLRILASLAARRTDEPPKVVAFNSLGVTLARSLIHLIPALVSVSLVVINARGRFIGTELQGARGQNESKLAAIQIAAKVQVLTYTKELFIMSSLGSIILHVLRNRLLYGHGLPLGLLGSDKAFTQISFFWSVEFWGGLAAYFKKSGYASGLLLGTMLLYAGIIALFAGPATAILMLPRVMEWPVGGAIMPLNKTEAQLWPSVLDSRYAEDLVTCRNVTENLRDAQCPAAGFLSLQNNFARNWSSEGYDRFRKLDEFKITKVIYAESDWAGFEDTWAYTTHSAVTRAQDLAVYYHKWARDNLRAWHGQMNTPDDDFGLASSKEYRVETTVPMIETYNPRRGPSARKNMEYDLLDVSREIKAHMERRNITIQSPADMTAAAQRLTDIVIPIHLPASLNGSIGLVYYKSAATAASADFDILTCLVDAHWLQGRSVQYVNSLTEVNREDEASSSPDTQVRLGLTGMTANGIIPLSTEDTMQIDRGEIRISPEWFDFMSPFVTDEDMPSTPGTSSITNRTVMERFLSNYGISIAGTDGGNGFGTIWARVRLEIMLSVVLAERLSRCGMEPTYDVQPWTIDFPGWDGPGLIDWARTLVHRGPPTTRLRSIRAPESLPGGTAPALAEITMEAIFTGYAMLPTNTFDYFCMALLLSHALVALAHTVLCLTRYRGRMHETWDSTPQLVALAQQSPPAGPGLLDNTCGGVGRLRTAARVVVVEVSGVAEDGPEELQFRVRHGFRRKVAGQGHGLKGAGIVAGRKYGRKPGPRT